MSVPIGQALLKLSEVTLLFQRRTIEFEKARALDAAGAAVYGENARLAAAEKQREEEINKAFTLMVETIAYGYKSTAMNNLHLETEENISSACGGEKAAEHIEVQHDSSPNLHPSNIMVFDAQEGTETLSADICLSMNEDNEKAEIEAKARYLIDLALAADNTGYGQASESSRPKAKKAKKKVIRWDSDIHDENKIDGPRLRRKACVDE